MRVASDSHPRNILVQGSVLMLALALAIVVYWLLLPKGEPIAGALAVAVLAAVLWISDVLPLAVTALLIPVALSAVGVFEVTHAFASFGSPVLFLVLGGYALAVAVAVNGVDGWMARTMLERAGTRTVSVVLALMTTSAVLSMLISNTATTLMMLPIGLASIVAIESLNVMDTRTIRHFGTVLMLSIAYGANIGGIATLVGTPPNIVFISSAASLYPDLPEIGFLQWTTMALPVTLILLPVIWLLLTRFIYKIPGSDMENARNTLADKRRALGPMRIDEKKVLVVFLLTAAGWIFRKDIVLGSLVIPGWSELFPQPGYINDATVAITAAIVLFITPVDRTFKDFLVTWKEAQAIPWGILILFGGGIALAAGFASSGLSEWMGMNLELLRGLPVLLFIFVIALIVTFLTEITSNIATTSLLMPVMGGLAVGLGFHPYLFMLPAVLSASCAFMLPVATPPNAIVFGSGRIEMMQMAKTGFIINIFGAVVITGIVYFIARPLLNL